MGELQELRSAVAVLYASSQPRQAVREPGSYRICMRRKKGPVKLTFRLVSLPPPPPPHLLPGPRSMHVKFPYFFLSACYSQFLPFAGI